MSVFIRLMFALVVYFTLIGNYAYAQQKSMKAYISLFPAGDFVATTSDISGHVTMSPDNKITGKDIKINFKKISTGIELRDEHLKTKYLEVGEFPEAILIEASGKDGKGTATISLKKKEAKVSGTYTIIGQNKFIFAKFNILLSAFDINDIKYKGIGVDDEVKIEVIIPILADTLKPAAVPVKELIKETTKDK